MAFRFVPTRGFWLVSTSMRTTAKSCPSTQSARNRNLVLIRGVTSDVEALIHLSAIGYKAEFVVFGPIAVCRRVHLHGSTLLREVASRPPLQSLSLSEMIRNFFT